MADIRMDAAYMPSEDVVARKIGDELIIVPLIAGVGDMEDELYTLRETGREIWDRLDGKKTLQEIAAELSEGFEAPPGKIEQDVAGLVAELLKRRIVVQSASGRA